MEHKDDPFPENLVQIQSSLNQTDEEEADPRIPQLGLIENNLGIPHPKYLISSDVLTYCAGLAPCNKLPSELIGEIIMLTAPELQPLPLANSQEDPRIHYTQICSHWRSAAFDVNQLWNNVNVKRCHNKSPIMLVAAWFRQASTTQVVLKISGFPASFESSDAEYLWKELLVPYSSRLKSFDSILMDANHFHSIPFDALTTLSLICEPRNDNPGGYMMASSLRHLRIMKIPSIFDRRLLSFIPQIPWEQLVSLSLDGWLSFDDVREILLQCKLLEHCQLDTINASSSGTVQNSVDLPRLQSLQIKFSSPELFRELVSLVVPNLSTLTINLPPSIPDVLERFAQFMETLKGALRYLEITKSGQNIHGSECSLDDIMHMFPFVTHLVAKELCIAPDTLEKCGIGELLPDIEALEFLARYEDRIEDIVDLLVPRQPSHRTSCLRDIYIHTYQRYCSGQRLKDLHSQGINIWAVYRYPHVPGVGPGGCHVGTWTLL